MPLSNVLSDLIEDFDKPSFLYQAGAIAACIVFGWGLGYAIRRAWLRGRTGGGVVQMGVESFSYVLSPLAVVGFLALARWLFASQRYNVHLLRLALPLFASLAVIRLAFYLMRRVFARHGPVGAAILTFEKIFAMLVWLAVALYIAGLWPDVFEFLDDTKLPLGKNKVSMAAILQAIVSVVVLLMLALWAGASLEERLMGVQGIHTSSRAVIGRMSRAVLIIIAVLGSLTLVGIDLTVLSVFGGALGVGLGLGMQKIASNYVSGFVILLERSLAIGDMISVDKFTGKVTHINTRYTILEGLDGVETVLPNEMLISGPVQNQSLSHRSIRVATTLSVAYDSDLDVVMPLLEQQPHGVERVLDDPAPGVSLTRFGADGYDLELGFWISDPENGRGGVLSEVNKKIYALIQAGQIKLAYPSRDTRLLDAQMVSVLAGISRP
ncbi:mechanosensitive ion channel [Massilia sp. P8910]|uniref:mechanosensitive ion channel family protein n=1 Tax=Massilia antarctica TaxID=2765360 RepID=UPI0006BB5A87|nr:MULTISPECIES: mechanosensitive ion channel domain-containing protein [Massilia]MCE3603794.1 mechanosensitive ion channel [Massilia antarctica]MCY0911276.1 mechanosensitive ion channel [Massilia sp. H27-R4]CUI05129.1 Potassium efflux system KefA protein / Small-conductance mechanosensitive channel [Janthinobacterium sp. CG23_2]CUU28915.1 Potassium efflux system KefA protein / Small-conductance mechanosensitive channel [Janthinobacterium sp. CG23_2]